MWPQTAMWPNTSAESHFSLMTLAAEKLEQQMLHIQHVIAQDLALRERIASGIFI